MNWGKVENQLKNKMKLSNKFIATALAIAGLYMPLLSNAQAVPLGSQTTEPWLCYDFTTNLKGGKKGADVVLLQYFLKKENISTDASEMGTYGQTTVAGITAFQEKYKDEILTPANLMQGSGIFGKLTRAKLNALYGCNHTALSWTNQPVSLAVRSMYLDANGLTGTFCNAGTGDVPSFPVRLRLNGINRDFDIVGALKAGSCADVKLGYETWGLTYDANSTFGAVVLMDPNGMYKKGNLVYPVATTTLNVPAVTGYHMAIRSIVLKSNGIQVTACNLGTIDMQNYPVRVTVNGTAKDLDIPGAYQSGKCGTQMWSYDTWGLTYKAGTTYSVLAITDPNNVYKEVNELDNAAAITGTP
jgi:hypothetical protein